jgi:hypothetical protein
MNATSRAIFQTVLASDSSLSAAEQRLVRSLIDGEVQNPVSAVSGTDEHLLVTQKRAAQLLGVSRATVWRMTRDCLLHPVEIIPGTWRYPFRELAALTRQGEGGTPTAPSEQPERSAA